MKLVSSFTGPLMVLAASMNSSCLALQHHQHPNHYNLSGGQVDGIGRLGQSPQGQWWNTPYPQAKSRDNDKYDSRGRKRFPSQHQMVQQHHQQQPQYRQRNPATIDHQPTLQGYVDPRGWGQQAYFQNNGNQNKQDLMRTWG